MTLAFVFPGQGSQSVGMLKEMAEAFPVVGETFAEASAALGYDLWRLTQEGPEVDLNQTQHTQPAMLAAGVAVWRAWTAQGGVRPALLAGHSLGEYTALVCAGAIEFADAAALVAERGRFMQEAVPAGRGAMAAILGLDDAQVDAVCTAAAQGQVVSSANLNSPGQVVIAGETEAVSRAIDLAREAGARRAVLLPVSVPSHCALMNPAAQRLADRLEGIPVSTPSIPVLHNVDAGSRADAQALRLALVEQLFKPVRWVETVRAMAAAGVTRMLECGPGKVLTGLNKRIDKGLDCLAVYDPDTLTAALER